jgi:carbon starvation protein
MPRMSALKLVLWVFLAVLGSVALAFVVGLINPQEKVNGLWLVVAAACIYDFSAGGGAERSARHAGDAVE